MRSPSISSFIHLPRLLAALLFTLPLHAGASAQSEFEISSDGPSELELLTSPAVQPRGPRLPAPVRLEWLSGDACWFREDVPGAPPRYTRLDLTSGERTPLFDSTRLSASLAQHFAASAPPNASAPANEPAPSIESLTLSGRRLILLLRDHPQVLSCDLDSYAITDADPADLGDMRLPLQAGVQRSRDGGPSSGLLIVNSTPTPVSMVWIDASGSKHPYATVKPGDSYRQHTFAGHAWAFERPDGSLLGSVRARRDPRIVILGAVAQPPSPPPQEPTPQPPARDPANSPDGAFTVFFRDNNAGLRSLPSGEEHMLTTDGTPDNAYNGPVFWSPDSAHVVFLHTAKGDDRKVFYIQSSPDDQLQPRLRSYDYPKPGDKLPQSFPILIDAKAARIIPVPSEFFSNPWSIDDLRWDPDSSRFTFLYNQRGHQVLRVIAVNASSGAPTAIINETSSTFIDYSQKTFRHDLDATGEIIWASERDGWNHLYLIDSHSGTVKNQITSGPWVVRGVDRVDPDNRQVWFHAGGMIPSHDPYYIHYARVNFDGSGLTLLTAADGTHDISFSPDRRYIVDTYSRVDLPPATEIRRAADGTRVTELQPPLASLSTEPSPSLPTRFTAKGRDGVTDIYGMILWPRDFDPARKYPVIESIYAGPHGAHVPKAYQAGYGQQEMTDRGFIVVMIDGMGTNWRSKAFHDVCWKNIGDAGFPDRIAWIKAAAQRFPQMDLDNGGRGVGIYGGSAGGQNAMRALIDHHDFYKVAVADCGCHDNRMDKIWWNEAWMGWPVGPEYEASSNVAQAHKLGGHLLLMVGEMDENVDPASTMQVVNALIKADKDFDMLVIPGAGHGSAESPYGRKRRLQHFMRYLAAP